jgi:hypothetical protein
MASHLHVSLSEPAKTIHFCRECADITDTLTLIQPLFHPLNLLFLSFFLFVLLTFACLALLLLLLKRIHPELTFKFILVLLLRLFKLILPLEFFQFNSLVLALLLISIILNFHVTLKKDVL